MKKITLLLIFVALNFIFAQELSKMSVVGKPEQQPGEIIGGVKDRSGDLCAGVIIESDLPGLTFKSNDGIVKVNSEPGRWFLFVSQDERLIRVYSQAHAPLAIIMNEYGIRLKSGEVWKFVVTGDKKGSDLIPVNFIVNPPDAYLMIGGNTVTTAAPVKLAPGKHQLAIRKDGYLSIEEEIEISENKTLFRYELKQVDLEAVEISSVPDKAKITLNGQLKEKETNAGFFLMPGEYTVRLQKDGYLPVEEKITVRPQGTNKFSYRLQRNSGKLELTITPSDARVLLNKEERSGKSFELAPGAYKIEIQKEGYYSASETVEIPLNQTVRKTYTLTAKTGKLLVSVTPVDADVVLLRDGSVVEKWKGLKSFNNLFEGQYELQVSAAGYETKRVSVTVTEGRTTTEDIVLREASKFVVPLSSQNQIDSEYPRVTAITIESNTIRPSIGLICGIGGSGLSGEVAVPIGVEYNFDRFDKNLQFGAYVGLAESTEEVSFFTSGGKWFYRNIIIGVQVNLHFFPSEKFDPFIGCQLGYNVGSAIWEWNEKPAGITIDPTVTVGGLVFSGQAGFNYWFNSKVAIQVKAGLLPYLGAGIIINL